MPLHKDLTTSNIHIAYAYSYANAAARTGAGGFVAADLGKIAWQTDNNSFWSLVATTPTWVELTNTSLATIPVFTTDVVASDQAASSTSKVTTTLEIAVAANTNYLFDGALFFDANTTSDMQCDVTGPASPTDFYMNFSVAEDGTGSTVTAFSSATGVLGGATGVVRTCRMAGILRNGANAGTVVIRFSTNSGTNTCTVKRGSWLRMQTL